MLSVTTTRCLWDIKRPGRLPLAVTMLEAALTWCLLLHSSQAKRLLYTLTCLSLRARQADAMPAPANAMPALGIRMFLPGHFKSWAASVPVAAELVYSAHTALEL